jgi:hypothetical protein
MAELSESELVLQKLTNSQAKYRFLHNKFGFTSFGHMAKLSKILYVIQKFAICGMQKRFVIWGREIFMKKFNI